MASKTEICNFALGHLGYGQNVANIETEKSQEAAACRRFYELARDNTLKDGAWPFATKIAALGLIEEDPNEEWAYSYRYPSDCIDALRILSGNRNDTIDSKISYKISNDESGLVIYTDQTDAELEYVSRVTDPNLYPTDFVMALSYMVASLIAPSLTLGDNFKLGQQMIQYYQAFVSRAKANAYNEEQPDVEPDPELIRTRNS